MEQLLSEDLPCLTGYDHRFSDTGVCVRCGVARISAQTFKQQILSPDQPCTSASHRWRPQGSFFDAKILECARCGKTKKLSLPVPQSASSKDDIDWDEPGEVPAKKQRLLKRDGRGCHYCTRDFPLIMLTVDHVIPRSKNGSNADRNCVLACSKCNTEKDDKLLKDWTDRWYLRGSSETEPA